MVVNGYDLSGQTNECGKYPIRNLSDGVNLLGFEAANPTNRLHIEFTNLSYGTARSKATQKKRDILRSVSGHFRPGRLTAIIGPSGAGKSTLLSIISGLRSSNLKGSIAVNGVERNAESFRKQACYIPQEFALLSLLTVRETLRISADLKLGWPHTVESKRRTVTDIASKLGLLSCLDTAAGDLSGGERKRLSIGVELITNPPVMLLDEPTSGLDSAGSAQVIALLQTLAHAGQTVVCAVHQPGSKLISMFDDILVLSRGEVVYCGPREDILETFAVAGHNCPQLYNIAEFVLETVTKPEKDLVRLLEVGKERFQTNRRQLQLANVPQNKQQIILESSGCSSDYSDEYERPSKGRYATSGWKQFIILFNRAMICALRDNTLTKLRIVAHLAVGVLVGFIFYDFGNDAAKFQSNTAAIFTSLLFVFFANAMPAVQMFPLEAAVFLREHLNNWYCFPSYYLAKVLADVQVQVICPTCYLVLYYWLTGQPLEIDRIWRVWLIFVLLTMLAQSYGIVCGAACGTEMGVFLVPALNIPMFLFAGFFVKLGEVSAYLRYICYISYFRYAFEGVLQALYGNSREKLPCSADFCLLKVPSKMLSSLDMPTMPFYVTTLSLLAWIIVLHSSVYVIFRWKLYRSIK